MTFLNPAVLFGLVAATIPIVLHFFNLRRLQTVEFSTLSFLKELQRTRIRNLKITQLLLLLLRVLIVVFAVIAFARPAVQTSLPGIGAKAKSSVVIILDNSFSMDVADERGVRLKQAKDAALNILNTLSEGDEVALVQMADLTDKRFIELTRNFGLVREELQKLPISYTTAKLESSLRLASSILSNSKNLNREVFIITDAQRNIVEDEQRDSLKLFDAATALYLIPIGLGSKAGERNLSVDSLRVVTRLFEAGKPVEIEARVRNSSNDAAQGVLVSVVLNDERVAQRTVDIPAGGTRTIAFAVVAPERERTRTERSVGLVRGRVEVEGDVLDADNRRHFAFVLPEKPSVALIGMPEETTFLELALAPERAAGQSTEAAGRNSVTKLGTEALAAANLSAFDVVFLVNIPRFSTSDIARLQHFLEGGGGVVIFAGDKSDVNSYNSTILSALQLGQAAAKEYPAERPGEFSAVDRAHPLFTGVFKPRAEALGKEQLSASLAGRAGVESPKLVRALPLVGVGASLPSQAIIELPDGAFWAESRVGSGKVLYCAVPPTTAFGNFPLTGLFVTLVNRSAAYLSASTVSSTETSVGESVTVVLSGKYAAATLTVLDPNNTESLRQAVQLPSGTSLTLDALRQPGIYALQAQSGGTNRSTGADRTAGRFAAIVHTVAVNPPASESSIVLLKPEELVSRIAPLVPKPDHIRLIENAQQFDPELLRAGAGTELWRLFVVLALLCAVAEMLIARRAASGSGSGSGE